ncbi:MAG: hypothetical protein ABR954_08330 [Dehalococcoidales bacterium]
MNDNRIKRLARIKPLIRQLIASQAIRYPYKPRIVLASDLKYSIERIGEIPPSEETLIKMISNARNQETSPLDNPWHLGTLFQDEKGLPSDTLEQKYTLSSEAIPYILKALWWGLEYFEDLEFTIRQAKWAARLNGFESLNKPGCLYLASFWYAHYEKICGLSKADFDTRWFDDALDDFQKLQKEAAAYNYGVPEKMFKAGIENSPTPVPHKSRVITI